jgi:hypothetical protein
VTKIMVGVRHDCGATHYERIRKLHIAQLLAPTKFCLKTDASNVEFAHLISKDRGVHRVLVGKPEGKRPLGRPRRRW